MRTISYLHPIFLLLVDSEQNKTQYENVTFRKYISEKMEIVQTVIT